MRVLTPFGLGDTDIGVPYKGRVLVTLDVPYLGEKQLELDGSAQVFPFTNVAVVRVINVAGHGVFSNLSFYVGTSNWGLAMPPDETIFLLNISKRDVVVTRELNQEVIWIQPWVDRWALDKTQVFDDTFTGAAAFRAAEEKTVRTTEGVFASILLNVREKEILCFRFHGVLSQGVFFERDFV